MKTTTEIRCPNCGVQYDSDDSDVAQRLITSPKSSCKCEACQVQSKVKLFVFKHGEKR